MISINLQNRLILGLIVTSVFALPFSAEARTVVRSGDTVSITQDQLIEGDLYVAASIVNISGEISEDLLAVGAEVTLNGKVGKDVFFIGGNVDVHGSVGDDLRVIGGNVIVAEPILGDVFIVGGTVKILSTASVTGDVTVMGGSLEISGPVGGKVLGWTESVRIDSQIEGDIELTTGSLTLGDNANIGGKIQYISKEQLVRSQSAVVDGDIVRNDPVLEASESSATNLLLPVLIILFSVALWYLLSRRMLQRVVNKALMPNIRAVLIGILVALLTPFAVSILMVSMLGFLAGLALLSAYILFSVLALVAAPAVIGQFLVSLLRKEVAPVNLITLIVGSVVIGLCFFVPVIGPVIFFGFYLLAFGSLVDLLIRSNR